MMNIGLDKVTIDKLKNYAADVKNQVANAKNETERSVYDALNNKNWGASSTILNDIARDSYDFSKYNQIMTIVWQSLDSPAREWRKVFKALCLLEHLIKNGTERVVEDSRDHLHRIKLLAEFNYFEGHMDKGSGVREKSRQLIELLKNNDAIREEREKARKLRDKYIGISNSGSNFGGTSSRYDGVGSSMSDRDFGGGGGGTSRYSYSDTYHVDEIRQPSYDNYSDEPIPANTSTKSFESDAPEPVVKPKKTPKKKVPMKEEPVDDLLGGDVVDFDPRAGAAVNIPPPQTKSQVSAPAAEWDAFAVAPSLPPAIQPSVIASSTSFDPFGTSSSTFDPFASPAPILPKSDLSNNSYPAIVQPQPQNDLFGMMQQSTPVQQPFFGGSATLLPSQNVQRVGFGGIANPIPGTMSGGFGGPVNPMHGTIGGGFGGSMNPIPGGMGGLQQGNFGGLVSPMSGTTGGINTFNMNPSVQSTSNVSFKSLNDASVEFGDFQAQSDLQSLKGASQNINPTVTKKWGDVSSLIDLGGLKTNTEKKHAEDVSSGLADRQNTTAFVGLDGFRDPSRTMSLTGFNGSSQFQQSSMMRGGFSGGVQQPSPSNQSNTMGGMRMGQQQWPGGSMGGIMPQQRGSMGAIMGQQGGIMLPQQGSMTPHQMGSMTPQQGGMIPQQRMMMGQQVGPNSMQGNMISPQNAMNAQQNSMMSQQHAFIQQQGGFSSDVSRAGNQGSFF